MRGWLPILIVLAACGRSVSFSQSKQPTDPFDRYMSSVKARRAEPELQRIGVICGIDLLHVAPRFAVNPGADWIQTKDLAKAVYDLESDFFSTVEVWPNGAAILVETWSVDSTAGSETRAIHCFKSGRPQRIESIDWSLPFDEDSKGSAWGYEQLWEKDANGKLLRKSVRFVDGYGQTIPRPKLTVDDKPILDWKPRLGTLSELKLPQELLR